MTIPNSNAFRHRKRLARVLIGTGAALLPAIIGAAQPQTSGWTSRDPAQQVHPSAASSQSGTVVRSAPVYSNASRVQGVDYREIDRYANALVAGQRVPGLAIVVVRNGKIEFMKGYGITDTQRPEPVDTHTVFRLASLSKSFASALASLLVQQGRITVATNSDDLTHGTDTNRSWQAGELFAGGMGVGFTFPVSWYDGQSRYFN